jgi:hypothetical protein
MATTQLTMSVRSEVILLGVKLAILSTNQNKLTVFSDFRGVFSGDFPVHPIGIQCISTS